MKEGRHIGPPLRGIVYILFFVGADLCVRLVFVSFYNRFFASSQTPREVHHGNQDALFE